MIDSSFQQVVNNELKGLFARKLKESHKVDKRLPELIEQIADVTLRGGDRMRPYFCALGFQIATNQLKTQNLTHKIPGIQGLKFRESLTILPALLALELTHTFALIHDDIMDGADTRRRGSTIHAYFTKNLRNDQLATSLGILAGDLAYLWADELFDQLTIKNSSVARTLFNIMREETIYGQIRDVWGMYGASTSEVLKLYDLKSGRYSVEKPLLIGATLGGGEAKLLSQLSQYGRKVGMAFQIQDDILGVFGNEENTGKSITSDITECKWTILISEMYIRLNSIDQKKLSDFFMRGNMRPIEVEWVKKQIALTRAIDEVKKIMQRQVKEALQNIQGFQMIAQTNLRNIAQFATSRTV